MSDKKKRLVHVWWKLYFCIRKTRAARGLYEL